MRIINKILYRPGLARLSRSIVASSASLKTLIFPLRLPLLASALSALLLLPVACLAWLIVRASNPDELRLASPNVTVPGLGVSGLQELAVGVILSASFADMSDGVRTDSLDAIESRFSMLTELLLPLVKIRDKRENLAWLSPDSSTVALILLDTGGYGVRRGCVPHVAEEVMVSSGEGAWPRRSDRLSFFRKRLNAEGRGANGI